MDQIFGNTTQGPDGKFADNGYGALAKYDSNHDGMIDQRDPIYGRLRVWVDYNRNGVAESGELLTLKQADIANINLNFSTAYSETDTYGNTANMKSIIGRFDGSREIIFDLWFIY